MYPHVSRIFGNLMHIVFDTMYVPTTLPQYGAYTSRIAVRICTGWECDDAHHVIFSCTCVRAILNPMFRGMFDIV